MHGESSIQSGSKFGWEVNSWTEPDVHWMRTHASGIQGQTHGAQYLQPVSKRRSFGPGRSQHQRPSFWQETKRCKRTLSQSPERVAPKRRPLDKSPQRKKKRKHTGEDHCKWDAEQNRYTLSRKGITICQRFNMQRSLRERASAIEVWQQQVPPVWSLFGGTHVQGLQEVQLRHPYQADTKCRVSTKGQQTAATQKEREATEPSRDGKGRPVSPSLSPGGTRRSPKRQKTQEKLEPTPRKEDTKPARADLLDDTVTRKIVADIRAGVFDVVSIATPCETAWPLREKQPGPRPLRSL